MHVILLSIYHVIYSRKRKVCMKDKSFNTEYLIFRTKIFQSDVAW